eukprot:2703979-Pleurochrysis_carterae.AAC.1
MNRLSDIFTQADEKCWIKFFENYPKKPADIAEERLKPIIRTDLPKCRYYCGRHQYSAPLRPWRYESLR